MLGQVFVDNAYMFAILHTVLYDGSIQVAFQATDEPSPDKMCEYAVLGEDGKVIWIGRIHFAWSPREVVHVRLSITDQRSTSAFNPDPKYVDCPNCGYPVLVP